MKFLNKIDYPIPDAAPEPANPIKWPLPIFEANKDAPIYYFKPFKFKLYNRFFFSIYWNKVHGSPC